MQNTTRMMQNPSNLVAAKTVRILLFPRFSNMCLANVLEPLRAATNLGHTSHFRWSIETRTGEPVASSSGMQVLADQSWSPHDSADYLFVISSYAYQTHVDKSLGQQLRQAHASGQKIIGIDTGAWLLASAGLLNGHRSTIHHQARSEFEEAFLEVDVVNDAIAWNDASQLGTCADARAAMALSLDIIEFNIGQLARLDVETLFLGQSDAVTNALPVIGTQRDPVVSEIIKLVFQHIEDPLPLDAAAKRLNLSPRSLNQKLTTHLGVAYKALTMHVRLSTARQLAETTSLSALEIAVRTGFCSGPNLHRAYRAQFGRGLWG